LTVPEIDLERFGHSGLDPVSRNMGDLAKGPGPRLTTRRGDDLKDYAKKNYRSAQLRIGIVQVPFGGPVN
jgi:hypothetical protein